MQETKPSNVQRGGRRAPGVEAAVRRWYVGGAAVEAGGFTSVHWSRLEEEGADSCRGEGKLSAGAVGVTEEGAATPVAVGRHWRKEDCCWPRWLQPLLSPLLLESRWQRRRFLFCREERERKRGTVIGGEVAG